MSNYSQYRNLGSSNSNPNPNVPPVHSVKSQEDKQAIIAGNKICVVDVYGDWCGPCKSIAPKYAEIAHKYNRSGICAVISENADLSLSPDIKGVPTFLFYKEGQLIHSITGADIKGVESAIKHLLKN